MYYIMINFDTAYQLIMAQARNFGSERVALNECLNRVLAEDVISDVNMPPFNKAAVDGYACRRNDLKTEMKLISVTRAGEKQSLSIAQGECVRIMTGAEVPNGADCVFMLENSNAVSENRIVFEGEKTADNIARFAEDVKLGDTVLEKGSLVNAGNIALLAAVGCTQPLVFKKPSVGIITTGDEIVEPEQRPIGAQIRNSNGPQLMAQLLQMSIPATYYGIVGDDFSKTKNCIAEAIATNNIVFITGGVSMGEFDFVKDALRELGTTLIIEKISIKPGKPTVFAKNKNCFVFGMPGNPVSSFVIFELLAKPFLQYCMGLKSNQLWLKLPLENDKALKSSDRTSFVPAKIDDNSHIELLEYHGSAHIHAISGATCIARIMPFTDSLKKEDTVDVRLF